MSTIWQPIAANNQSNASSDQCSYYPKPNPLPNNAEVLRKQKHRLTEKHRHKKIIDLISELSEMIGLNGKQKQNCVLNCATRYAIFLTHMIDTYNEHIHTPNQSSTQLCVNLHEIHRKACERVASLQNSDTSLTLKKKSLKASLKRNNCDERYCGLTDTISQYYANEAVITAAQPESYDEPIVMRSPIHTQTPDHCLPLKKRARMLMYTDLI